MPAKTAGSYPVIVTTAGGPSNSVSIEAWAPTDDASCKLLYDAKHTPYNASAGTWAARYSSVAGANASSIVGGANHPSDGSGGIYFDGDQATEAGLKDNVGWSYYLGSVVNGTVQAGSAFTVHSSQTTYANTTANIDAQPYALPSVVGNQTQGTIGISNAVLDGVHVLAGHVYGSEGYKAVYVPMATTGLHAAVCRWSASVGGGGFVQLSLDGATSGSGYASRAVAGDGSTTINYLGIITLGDAYAASGPGTQYFKGSLKAWGIMNAPASDTFVQKFNRWKQARYG